MPTSTLRLAGLRQTMELAFPPSYRQNDVLISSQSWCACGEDVVGMGGAANASTAWPTANLAIYVPFEIAHEFLIQVLYWVNGGTVGTDSVDVAVYTEAGVRVINGGGTLSAGASIVQQVDVADTLIQPGRYWMGMACSGTTATFLASAPAAAILRAAGVTQQATAYTLPDPMVPAAMASAYFPMFGLATRTQVA